MEIIANLIKLMAFSLGSYLLVSSIYIFVHSIAGHYFKKDKIFLRETRLHGVVFIPAYKEDAVIHQVAEMALDQKYEGSYDVVVIADQLKKETISKLQSLPIHLVEVNFEKSTKSKALNLAMDRLSGNAYDFAVVLDADNVMKPGAIQAFANYIGSGYEVVQGRRTAANLENDFSFLDSLSEEMNNHIYNAGSNALKCSSRIVGSGVAFEYGLFKKTMNTINVVGGFDKALELKLIQAGHRIVYAPEIVTFDEKVDDPEVFGNQRSRWLSAQYQFFFQNIKEGFRQLFKGNLDYIVKLYQYILPPRLLFPIICLVGTVMLLPFFFKVGLVWGLSFLFVFLSYLIAIPRRLYGTRMLASAGSVLNAAMQTVKALSKMNSAAKTFVHTPHKGTELNNYENSN